MSIHQTMGPSYAIITPAHNEGAFLERTIRSVVAQRVRPTKWVIVNDASTDNTKEIAESFAQEYSFIQVVTIVRSEGRHFGNKVRAFNRGLSELAGIEYNYVGNLDADISMDDDYFELLLNEFSRDTQLGLAGGMVHSRMGNEYVSQNVALDSVAGAVQLFRRQCFDQVGGYLMLPHGGIDAAAEVTARMKGWKVRTFPGLRVLEHRRTGSATARPLAARIKEGHRMLSLGYGPVFFLIRCVYRISEPPFLIGSCAAYLGYISGRLRGEPIMLPRDAVQHLRNEHRRKIRRLVGLSSRGL